MTAYHNYPAHQSMLKTYYGNFVPQNLLDEIFELIPNEEWETAMNILVEILDYQALQASLAQLKNETDSIEFLEILRDQYLTEHPLEWLTLKAETGPQLIAETIERTLLSIRSALKSRPNKNINID